MLVFGMINSPEVLKLIFNISIFVGKFVFKFRVIYSAGDCEDLSCTFT